MKSADEIALLNRAAAMVDDVVLARAVMLGRVKMNVTPAALDTLCNGIKVYFNQRHDGTLYASTHDFSRFNVESIDIIRVRPTTAGWDVQTCPVVAAHLKNLQAKFKIKKKP